MSVTPSNSFTQSVCDRAQAVIGYQIGTLVVLTGLSVVYYPFRTPVNLIMNQLAAPVYKIAAFVGSEAVNILAKEIFTRLPAREIGAMIGRRSIEAFSEGFGAFAGASDELRPNIRTLLNNTFGEGMKRMLFDIGPYYLLYTSLATATPLLITYLYHKALHGIGKPKLATKIHQHSLFYDSKTEKNQIAPVFTADITKKIKEILQSVQNTKENEGYFQNILFYGPPGTGKTMISEWIAERSDMSYIKMSGGDLAQYIRRGEHVTELNKLMDKMELSWRPWSTKPWILFIDEAESFCRNRDHIQTPELLELQNAFLNRTGTQSKNFMVILSTNRIQDLDPAIRSRIDYEMQINLPDTAERRRIIELYIPHMFPKQEQQQFTPAIIQRMAINTSGLTGRSLFKLLNALAHKKIFQTPKNALMAIDQETQDFIKQEKARNS